MLKHNLLVFLLMCLVFGAVWAFLGFGNSYRNWNLAVIFSIAGALFWGLWRFSLKDVIRFAVILYLVLGISALVVLTLYDENVPQLLSLEAFDRSSVLICTGYAIVLLVVVKSIQGAIEHLLPNLKTMGEVTASDTRLRDGAKLFRKITLTIFNTEIKVFIFVVILLLVWIFILTIREWLNN